MGFGLEFDDTEIPKTCGENYQSRPAPSSVLHPKLYAVLSGELVDS